eukprot:scaffold7847_cov94-Cylindrotheca_fusiformis.AAC.2
MKGENLCAARWLTKLYYNPNPEQLVNLWLVEATITTHSHPRYRCWAISDRMAIPGGSDVYTRGFDNRIAERASSMVVDRKKKVEKKQWADRRD